MGQFHCRKSGSRTQPFHTNRLQKLVPTHIHRCAYSKHTWTHMNTYTHVYWNLVAQNQKGSEKSIPYTLHSYHVQPTFNHFIFLSFCNICSYFCQYRSTPKWATFDVTDSFLFQVSHTNFRQHTKTIKLTTVSGGFLSFPSISVSNNSHLLQPTLNQFSLHILRTRRTVDGPFHSGPISGTFHCSQLQYIHTVKLHICYHTIQ